MPLEEPPHRTECGVRDVLVCLLFEAVLNLLLPSFLPEEGLRRDGLEVPRPRRLCERVFIIMCITWASFVQDSNSNKTVIAESAAKEPYTSIKSLLV